MAEHKRSVRWILNGRVQGVAYRYFTRGVAIELGIPGWARNRPDGTVEVVVRASEADLEEMRRRLKEGPPMARVMGIEETPAPSGELPPIFEIRF